MRRGLLAIPVLLLTVMAARAEPPWRLACPGGASVVLTGGSAFFLDASGGVTLSGPWEIAGCFRHGLAWVGAEGLLCQITRSGRIVAESCACHGPFAAETRPGRWMTSARCYRKAMGRLWRAETWRGICRG